MKHWRLLDLRSHNALMNMAIDEALLKALVEHKSTAPTLRFYTWCPAAVSIGCLQKIPKNFIVTQCRKLGLDAIRRPTGGRIVLHKGDLTYSLVFAENSPSFPKGILPSYKKISQAIQHGLKLLGISSLLCSQQKINRSPFCFSLTAKYEILVNGKKIMGNAQKREKGAVLQQGSIMIDNHRSIINQLFAPHYPLRENRPEPMRENPPGQKDDFLSLSETLNGSIPILRIKDALIQGFKKIFTISLTPGSLTAWEKKEAMKLANDKYASDQWNMKGQL